MILAAYPDRGLTFVEGDGVFLTEAGGGRYLDLASGYGVAIFGYRHPRLVECLSRQLQRLPVLHGSFANDTRARAARALLSRCGGGLARVAFSNSGAEANEAALKFAALATGKKKFIACRGGYHGKTLGALSATDGAQYRRAFEPLVWDFRFVPYGDAAALALAIDDKTAAFIVEPIQGESGIRIPPADYLRQAAHICRARGVLTIIDEIQSGTGRTGKFLASQSEALSYDILTLGKGLGGGLPIGVTLVSAEVAEAIPKGAHTSTMGGNPLAAAGVLATLEFLDEARLAHIAEVGNYFLEALNALVGPLVKEIRGRGLMIGLETACSRDAVLKALQKERVLAIPAGDSVVRFLPPYILEKSHVDILCKKLGRILGSLLPETVRPCAGS
jgi:acetylornithine/LysW-gamma-L-lysine aminotransferase